MDDDLIMICDKCDKGFHAYCHEPKVDIDLYDDKMEWFCHSCSAKQSK